MHGQIKKYKIQNFHKIYHMCGLTYKKIFFQILCFIIVKYFDIDIVVFCLMCEFVSDFD